MADRPDVAPQAPDVPDTAPAAEPAGAAPPRPARGRRWPIAALTLVTVAGAGAAGYLAVAGPGSAPTVDPTAQARAAAVAAASQAVTNFTTYDYRTIKRDFDRVAAGATGAFAQDFRAGSGDLQRLIVAGKASAKGTVVAAGAQSFSPSHAVVLLAVDDTVRNVKAPDGAVRRYRFSVTVDLVDGRWLVSDLHPVT